MQTFSSFVVVVRCAGECWELFPPCRQPNVKLNRSDKLFF